MRRFIISAGTSQLTREGTQLQEVVQSEFALLPHHEGGEVAEGEKAPPALAATTMFTQHMATSSRSFPPRLDATAPINTAVVRLSAIGESQARSDP